MDGANKVSSTPKAAEEKEKPEAKPEEAND